MRQPLSVYEAMNLERLWRMKLLPLLLLASIEEEEQVEQAEAI